MTSTTTPRPELEAPARSSRQPAAKAPKRLGDTPPPGTGAATPGTPAGPVATERGAGLTNLTSRERWFHTLVQNSSDLIAVADERAHLIYANPAAERILGLEIDDWVGVSVLDILHPDDRQKAAEAFVRDLGHPGVHPPAAYRVRTAGQEWRVLEVVTTNCLDDPAIGGMVLNARDITEATSLARALRTLSQGNQLLVHAGDEASLLAATCSTIVDAGYLLAWVGYADDNEDHSVRHVSSAGRTAYLDELRVTWGTDVMGRGPVGTAIRTANAQVLHDMRRSKAFAPWRELAEKHGFRSACALPLRVREHAIGALAIYAGELGAFDPASLELLGQLADNLAYGIGRVRDATALGKSEERFRALAEVAPIGILESQPDGAVIYGNGRTAEITGRSTESLMGRGWAAAVHPDDLEELVALFNRLRPTSTTVRTIVRVRRPDGEVRHVRFVSAPKGGTPEAGHVTTIADITEEVQAQQELAHRAFHDSLTGLANCNLFLDRLGQELERHRRDGSGLAVLFLDLDRFKVINESLGHQAGDFVLKRTAFRLSRAVRAGETVARYGGDEFVFIIRGVRRAETATKAATRLLKVVQAPLRWAGQDLVTSASIGVVVPGPHANPQTVLRDAETAMYRAKEAGRDRFEVFDEGLHHRSVKRLTMESSLRQALARQELDVYFQPKVKLPSGRPMGAEALVRWHHPERGTVPPEEFIPVAEESGLIHAIGAWVFERAVSAVASWDADPHGPRLDVLAVNLSARQLDTAGTSDMVQEVLGHYGMAPERLTLEVTESVVMADSESTRSSLASFRDLGLRVSIDDFGTGYSSLSYLHTLPVTTVKVDRSFIERLGVDDTSMPVVQAIVDMTHAMGLRVVAEGVSNERLATLVSGMGFDAAQGFHWSRPVPAPEFLAWWRDNS